MVRENKLGFSILEYNGFIYLLMQDLIVIIDRGRPKEDAVKRSCGSIYGKLHISLNASFYK